MILPAMGIISELISIFSRKHIFGYHFIAFSQHRDRGVRLPRLGPPHVRQRPVRSSLSMIFSLLTFSVSIPSAVKVFNWLATMYGGSISLATPMLYVALVHLPLRHRRSDGPLPRRPRHRRAPARHLLRRRPLPLRDDGQHPDRDDRRLHSLVAEDDFGRMYSETQAFESPGCWSSSDST
jgi:hypothetical protein